LQLDLTEVGFYNNILVSNGHQIYLKH